MSKVLLLGGGIAGMSAAMELCEDHDVVIVERRSIAGGKARTWIDGDFNVFREHSFRVFHSTYHNTFDTMTRVSTGPGRTIRNDLVPFVSKADLQATGSDTVTRWLRSATEGTRVGWRERARLGVDAVRLLGVLSASDERLNGLLGDATFEEVFLRRDDGSRGLLFQGLKDMSQVEYSADRVHPDVKVMLNFVEKHFMHGLPGLAWNATVGPTSDIYIEPWKQHLLDRGVTFRHDLDVVELALDQAANRITGVRVAPTAGGRSRWLRPDHVVSALPSDIIHGLADRHLQRAAPELRTIGEVRRVWNNGVIVYNDRPIRVIGGYYMWHPWRVAVTSYANRWREPFDLSGHGLGATKGAIGDVISYVITDWFAPGPHTGKPAADCTPDELYDELCWMGLEDPSVMPGFDPRHHVHPANAAGETVRCMVDGSLVYGDDGRIVENEDTLAHLPAGYSLRMPGAATGVDNLFLAGCHVHNAFGCGDSMEGANETGRRAANAILAAEGATRRAMILEGRRASLGVKAFDVLRTVDRALYRLVPIGRGKPGAPGGGDAAASVDEVAA